MANIKVKKISITNFRNIEHAEYNLTDACCFVGKNYIGKTNSMLAIYWLLTGKMLDGSSNDESLKRKDAPKETVSVEIVFDKDGEEKTIKKEYAEKWTKTQGTSDLRLSGHITTYTIDGIVQKTNNTAIREINEYLELSEDKYFRLLKLDIQQALMNPTYVAETLEWQVLRQLIVNIIGDITDEDVFANEPRAISAKEILRKFNGDQNKAVKFLNQEISGTTKSIIEKEIIIKELSNVEDIPSEQLQEAREKLANIQESIKALKKEMRIENPLITETKNKIEALKKEIDNLLIEEKHTFNESCTILYNRIREANELQKQKLDDYWQSRNNIKCYIESSINTKTFELKNIELEIDFLLKQRAEAVEKFKEIQKRVFEFESVECPNCHYQLNKDAEDLARENFINNKNNDLDEINKKGKQINLDLTNFKEKKSQLEFEIFELNNQLNEEKINTQKLYEDYQKADNEYKELCKNKVIFEESENLKTKRIELKKLQDDLLTIQSTAKETTTQDQIKELQSQCVQYEEIIAKHYVYEENQKNKELKIIELESISKKKVEYELINESLSLFVKTKLKLLSDKISTVFADVKFCLMKENIKEGSWDEVCYPLIVGKNTPFKDGSTSEKIITGLKIIESLKKALNINGLPILIDECGQLDSQSLGYIKSCTSSQIIATKVADNYDKPYLINL